MKNIKEDIWSNKVNNILYKCAVEEKKDEVICLEVKEQMNQLIKEICNDSQKLFLLIDKLNDFYNALSSEYNKNKYFLPIIQNINKQISKRIYKECSAFSKKERRYIKRSLTTKPGDFLWPYYIDKNDSEVLHFNLSGSIFFPRTNFYIVAKDHNIYVTEEYRIDNSANILKYDKNRKVIMDTKNHTPIDANNNFTLKDLITLKSIIQISTKAITLEMEHNSDKVA